MSGVGGKDKCPSGKQTTTGSRVAAVTPGRPVFLHPTRPSGKVYSHTQLLTASQHDTPGLMGPNTRPSWGRGVGARRVSLTMTPGSFADQKRGNCLRYTICAEGGLPLRPAPCALVAKHPGSKALTSFPPPIHLFYFQFEELTLLLSLCSANL